MAARRRGGGGGRVSSGWCGELRRAAVAAQKEGASAGRRVGCSPGSEVRNARRGERSRALGGF